MGKPVELISASHHRNGICGAPFDVALFKDDDGTTKVFIDFGESYYAVLQTDLLAAGDIAFGSNSWRGDHYANDVRPLIAKANMAATPDAFFVQWKKKGEAPDA